MANILSVNDFKTGRFNIPDASSSTAYTKVTEAIGLYEDKYLNKLLGVDFAALIKAYMIAGSTNNSAYNQIINAFSYQPTGCPDILESNGINVLLKSCILYEYNKNAIKNTIAGAAVTQAEVSNTLSPSGAMRNAESYYNSIIDDADCIQQYCIDNPTTYPDFDGLRFIVKGSDFL